MGTPLEPEDLASSLTRFGFSDREAALYLVSLRRGRATARELTRDAQLDRVLGYRLLDAMRARGLVEVTTERPRRYAPVPPALILERHLRRQRTTLAEVEALAENLTVRLAAATAALPTGAARYQVLTGGAHIYDYLGEMTERAREQVEVMLTFRAMRDSLDHGLARRLGPFLARGGRFRMILESDPRLAPTLQRFRRTVRRFSGVEIRTIAPQPSRLTIIDEREALLFLVPEARERGADQVAVWTDHPGFVGGQRSYFDRTWAASDSVVTGGRPPTHRSRSSTRPSVSDRG